MSSQNNFSVVSTFSGCGGSSLGYKLAGGKVLLAVEMDNNAVETYRLNFPETKIYHGDIHDLSVEKVLEITRLKPGELDIFDGSPPCQGFSTAGKRDFCDPRNQLYNEYIRLLRGLQPKVFVMENVSGMVKGKMKLIFANILKELKASGYQVSARLMNAMYYNVPQSRKRMIFIGVRNDLNIKPSHPKPQTKPITVKKAIGHLEGLIEKKITKYNDYANYLNPGEKSADVDFPTKERDVYRLHPYKQCPTITRGSGKQLLHYSEKRVLDCKELGILQSFPENFKWITQCAFRIGNAVPPNMMKAIAEHIYSNILSQI